MRGLSVSTGAPADRSAAPAGTVAAHRHAAAAADKPDKIAALEEALQRRLGPLRFAPALEHDYQRDTGAGRVTRIAVCNVLGAVMTFINTSHDAANLPWLTPVLGPLRSWILALGLLTAALMLWRRRTLPAWVAETLTAGCVLLITAYVLIVAHDTGIDTFSAIRTGGLVVVFMHTGLAARQQFLYTLGLGVLMIAGYALAARSGDAQQATIVACNLRLMLTTFAFTLPANYILEYRERRIYLLRALDLHRRAALARDGEALRRLSLCDGLTGLANRRCFDAALRDAWPAAAEAGEPVAVLQLDVDFFKRYNDRHGHPAGDACLKQVAGALADIAQQHGGLAARSGGEEFALLLPRRSLDEAVAIGEALREAVQQLALDHIDSAVASCVTVSIGAAAAVPCPASAPAALLLAGDQALYAAKRTGRNRVARCEQLPAPTATVAEPPAPLPADDDDDDATLTALQLRIDTLTHALQHRLHRLRFPPALEAAYLDSGKRARALWLSLLGVGGVLYTLCYQWMNLDLLADVADPVMRTAAALGAVLLPVVALLHRPMPHWLRESTTSISTLVLSVGLLVAASGSQHVTLYSYSLGFFLFATFIAVVAAQPFRYSLVTAVLIVAGVAGTLRPDRPEWQGIWLDCTGVVFDAVLFSLIGGYLIDLSARRDHLLSRIGDARHALLTHNAERLRRLADVDPLTGLANRRKFDTELSALLRHCAPSGRAVSLLIVDIDHFKRYNDRHGHPAGDACLQRVAEALAQGALREAGAAALTARLGGEEFAVLLPDHAQTQALAVAERLGASVRGLGVAHGDSPVGPHVTVSIGAACTMTTRCEGGPLLRAADAALYRAKQHGRDRAEV